MIIPAKIDIVTEKLTFAVDKAPKIGYESTDNLNTPVFFRVSPCFAAFSRVFPRPTRLHPVSICYCSCQIRREAGTMRSKKTAHQRYYTSNGRRAKLAATGGTLPDHPGNRADLSARPGRPDQRAGGYDSLLPERNPRSGISPRRHSSSARPNDYQTGKGDRAHLAYSPDPAATPQNSEARCKIERKPHPSYLFPRRFPHASYIRMLLCLSDLEAHAQKKIHWTSLRSHLKNFFQVRFRFILGPAESQNATVASSSTSTRSARCDFPRLASVSADEKGGTAA